MRYGKIAAEFGGMRLPLQVLESAAGFYIGTLDPEGSGPYSRESVEFFETSAIAEKALKTGEWNQREHP